MTLFNRCIEVILKAEGGYQCDPDDIGNWTDVNDFNECQEKKKANNNKHDPVVVQQYKDIGTLVGTNFGISARLFPLEDIINLKRERAIELYHEHYWQPMNLTGINDANIVLHLFDHGVNAGKRTAIRMIQRIVEANPDGIVGPETKGKINTFGTRYEVVEGYGLLTYLVDHYKYARYRYYTDLTMRRPVTKKYLKGWYNRISNCNLQTS